MERYIGYSGDYFNSCVVDKVGNIICVGYIEATSIKYNCDLAHPSTTRYGLLVVLTKNLEIIKHQVFDGLVGEFIDVKIDAYGNYVILCNRGDQTGSVYVINEFKMTHFVNLVYDVNRLVIDLDNNIFVVGKSTAPDSEPSVVVAKLVNYKLARCNSHSNLAWDDLTINAMAFNHERALICVGQVRTKSSKVFKAFEIIFDHHLEAIVENQVFLVDHRLANSITDITIGNGGIFIIGLCDCQAGEPNKRFFMGELDREIFELRPNLSMVFDIGDIVGYPIGQLVLHNDRCFNYGSTVEPKLRTGSPILMEWDEDDVSRHFIDRSIIGEYNFVTFTDNTTAVCLGIDYSTGLPFVTKISNDQY